MHIRRITVPLVLLVLNACAEPDGGSSPEAPVRDNPLVPLAENHAHIRSAAGGELLLALAEAVGQDMGADDGSAIGADGLIAALDSAGVEKAQVLSVAYFNGFPDLPLENRAAGMRAENDWVAEQVARYPDRLYGACSVNPLDEWAATEVQRCAEIRALVGLKLHFANSDVDLRDPDHVAQVAEVFRRAGENDLPIVVHMRTRAPDYGARDVQVFVRDILSQAPDLPVQIAHMAGWGGYDDPTDEALSAFIQAFAEGTLDRALYTFDLAAVPIPPKRAEADTTRARELEEANARLVERIRELGTDRVLFATDWSALSIVDYAEWIPTGLSLTPDEMADIMDNVGPLIAAADGRR